MYVACHFHWLFALECQIWQAALMNILSKVVKIENPQTFRDFTYTLLHLLSSMSIISRDSTLLYLQFHFGFLKLLHNNFKGDFFQSRETALIWRQGFKRDPQHCKIILVDDHGVTNTFKLNDSWWSLVKIRSLFDHQSRGAPSSNQ